MADYIFYTICMGYSAGGSKKTIENFVDSELLD